MVKKTTKAQGKSSYGGSQDNTPIPHASSSTANKPTKRSVNATKARALRLKNRGVKKKTKPTIRKFLH
ncbi:unnamed protein product [Brassica oleracea var. botrytis]